MTKFGDRFGRFDDNSVIYRQGEARQFVDLPKLGVAYVLGSLLAAVLVLGAIAFLGLANGYIVAGVIILLYLVSYVIWRRRRNMKLTGSSTSWPSSKDGVT